MTPAALRRLADQKTAESYTMRSDADLLRAQGGALRGMLDPLISISQGVWVGPAATDFEQQSSVHAQRVNGVASDLVRIASEMESRARQLSDRAAELRRQASQAETGTPAGVI